MSTDSERVKENMVKHIYFVEENDSLKVAHELMQEEQFRHLPVLKEGKLVGILSDRDVLLAASTSDKGMIEVPDIKVCDAMTRHPVTCRETSSISDVAGVMIDRKIDCLPVVDERRKLVGVITSTDLLALIRDHDTSFGNKVIPFEFAVKARKASERA